MTSNRSTITLGGFYLLGASRVFADREKKGSELVEAPEGLKRIFRTSQRLEAYQSSIRDADMDSILDLMMKMAEALEFIRMHEQADGTVGNYLPAWLILKKFKDWK